MTEEGIREEIGEEVRPGKDQNSSEDVLEEFAQERIDPFRHNLLISAIYQILMGGILLALVFVFLSAIDGMEIFYPVITIATVPIYRAVGWTVISLALVQIVYVFLFRISRDKLGADTTFILGKILCLCMIPVIPTGTYFGFYGWKDLDIIFGKESNYEKIQIIKGDVSLQQADTSLGNTVLSSALVMLHMPIALLLVQLMLITLPIDMAYPLLAYNQTEPWAQVSWAILAVFLFQILCGLFYNKITQWNRNAAKYLVLFFVLFQLLSFSLFMQVLLTTMGPALELEGAMKIIIYLAWVFGILLNPLGVHFALMLKNELNAVQKIRE